MKRKRKQVDEAKKEVEEKLAQKHGSMKQIIAIASRGDYGNIQNNYTDEGRDAEEANR